MGRLCFVLVALLLTATPTDAATIYQFSGTLTRVTPAVSDLFGLGTGDSFSGYLLYDVPDPAPPPPPGFSVPDEGGVSWHFLWSVNGLTFSSASQPGIRSYAGSNRLSFNDFRPSGPQGTPTLPFWDDAVYVLDFASPLTSWNIDAGQFLSGAFGYSGFGPNFSPVFELGGRITSFQEVPEPSSILLLVAGAALVRRRITRRSA